MRYLIPVFICLVALYIQVYGFPSLKARRKQANETWTEAHEKAKAEPPAYPQADATDLNSNNWGTPT